MASYTVDILLALKGAQKLDGFNKQLAKTAEINDLVNKNMQLLGKNSDLVVRSFNSLNKAVSDAKKNFNAAASGTSIQKKAARELILAEKDLNKELKERERLLQSITLTGQRSSLMPGRSRTLLGQSVTPTGGASGRSRQILKEEQELQAALAAMDARDMKLVGQSVNIESKLQQALAKQTENKKRAETEVAKIRETALKKIETREKKIILLRKKALKQEIQDRRRLNRLNQTNVAGPASGFKAFSQRADEITARANRPGLGQMISSQFAQGGMFAATRNQRIKGSISNALIGGGFPLLFGQGALGAAGGGIGGAVGGALGGPFGFGLSIAGTAIAQRIQEGRDFQKQVDRLNKSIRLTGGESEFSVASIKKLGKELGLTKQEALQAAQSFEAFGAAARINLIKSFGDEATFNSLKNLRKTVDVLNNIDLIEKKIGKKRADQAVDVALAAGGLEAQKFILEEMFKLQMEEAKKGKLTGMDKFRATLSSMGQLLLGGAGKKNVFIAGLQQDMIDQTASAQAASMRDFNAEKRRLEARDIVRQISEPKEELKELMDPLKQLISLSRTVGDSFAESFKGIVRGSMTAQEALRNLFMRTADHFLDMAAQMIAKQIQMSILGIGLKFFGPSMAPSRGANTGGTDLFGRDFDDPMFGMPRGRANGGAVKGGSSYIVGERGPELFSPGVSGMITPNEMLGGSTNIVVNVDASGSSVEGDEDQGRQLGLLISSAVQSEIIQQQRPGGLLA